MDDSTAEPAAVDRLESPERGPEPGDDFINTDDLFYWMAGEEAADIPLYALGLEIPLCCRFCI